MSAGRRKRRAAPTQSRQFRPTCQEPRDTFSLSESSKQANRGQNCRLTFQWKVGIWLGDRFCTIGMKQSTNFYLQIFELNSMAIASGRTAEHKATLNIRWPKYFQSLIHIDKQAFLVGAQTLSTSEPNKTGFLSLFAPVSDMQAIVDSSHDHARAFAGRPTRFSSCNSRSFRLSTFYSANGRRPQLLRSLKTSNASRKLSKMLFLLTTIFVICTRLKCIIIKLFVESGRCLRLAKFVLSARRLEDAFC